MKGPTKNYICNSKGNKCKYLDSWYNGGYSCFGRCKKDVWKGIREWSPKSGCETPKNCLYIYNNQLRRYESEKENNTIW